MKRPIIEPHFAGDIVADMGIPISELVLDGHRRPWQAPQCTELSAEEAAEARNRFLTDEERREQDDVVRAARMGHNGPPDKLDDPLAKMTPRQIYERCVWISDESTITKISLLALMRYMRPHLQRGSSMSYSQLASDCGYSEATAKRFAKDMAGRDREKPRETFWLKVRANKGRYVPGKGHENLYWGVIPQRWEDELRHRKRAGIAVEPDEEIATKAGSEVSERHPETEAAEGYPDPQTEVSHRHPDNGAGYQTDAEVSGRYPENPGPGYHCDTRVSERLDGVSQRHTNGGKTGDKKKEGGADAPPDTKPKIDRASRLPENWVLPDAWRPTARHRGLSEQQIDAIAKRFYRHWTTQAGQKGLKLNWQRVWDNWVDNEIDKFGLKPERAAQSGLSDEDAWVADQMRTPKGVERTKSMGRAAAEKMLRDAYRKGGQA